MSWNCFLCDFNNTNVLSKCEMCDTQRPRKKSQQTQIISHNNQNDQYIQQLYDMWPRIQPQTHSNSKSPESICGFIKGHDPPTDPNNHPQHSLSNLCFNYNIGEEVFYPNNYRSLHDALKANDYDIKKLNVPIIQNNPNKYSLGQIIGINGDNYTVSIISDKEQNILTVHIALISKFEWFKYSEYKRGITVSFYDESQNKYNDGRIEMIIDGKSVGINYENDKFVVVPIYYLKAFEEIKEDEWSEASDFVFREYVFDIASDLARKSMKNTDSEHVIDPDKFRRAMERLGIRSLTSRNKAFQVFGEIKEDIIKQQRLEMEHRSETYKLLKNEGYIIGKYQCIGYCQQQRINDGLCLTNCKHSICKKDFKKLIDNVIQNGKSIIQCPVCIGEINPIDIQRHGTEWQYSVLTQLQLDAIQRHFGNAKCVSCGQLNDIMEGLVQYVCMYCGVDNCVKCKVSHPLDQSCEQYKAAQQHPLRATWKHNHDGNPQNSAVLTKVNKNSNEWKDIVNRMKIGSQKVLEIERIEHKALLEKYVEYASGLSGNLKEVRVWHGTRRTDPSLIYRNGFLKEKSRVGGCLWFAVNSSYSRRGFQHPIGNGKYQLFLCLVAGGNKGHVKYIRNDLILNVYKNEATYPAYLITYK